MEQKLEFLRMYKRNVQFVILDEINENRDNVLPSSWYELFQEKRTDKRIEGILAIWKKYVGVELRNTISYLFEHLVEI